MASPFPGMDPYIEDPELWGDFHSDLAIDYHLPPPPPKFDKVDAIWIEKRLQTVREGASLMPATPAPA